MRRLESSIMKFVAVLLTVALTACGTGAGNVKPVYHPPESTEAYKIGVGDQLQVNVWRNPELSMAVPVRPDGKISLPLVGDVAASGFAAEVLAQNIGDELKAFIRNPQVTVVVTNPTSSEFQRRIRITGAVNGQLSMPYRDGMTVLDVVLEAGGLSEFASGNGTKLYRNVDGEVKVYSVRLDDILNKGRLETNYLLLPSDIVTVPERAF